jgi:ribonuclease H2 subunit C
MSLTIQNSKTAATGCIPHLLPCKVNHDGPVNASERYWKAEVGQGSYDPYRWLNAIFTSTDGKHTAYFRGRKLQGRSVKLPEGYRGTCRVAVSADLNLL